MTRPPYVLPVLRSEHIRKAPPPPARSARWPYALIAGALATSCAVALTFYPPGLPDFLSMLPAAAVPSGAPAVPVERSPLPAPVEPPPAVSAPSGQPTPPAVQSAEPVPAAPPTPSPLPAPAPTSRTIMVERGQTLSMILSQNGAEPAEAQAAIVALAEVGDVSRLRIGQEIGLLTTERDGIVELLQVTVALDAARTLTARMVDGTFTATATALPVRRELVTKRLRVETNLYAAAAGAGLLAAVAPLLRAYSYDVDFQRGLRPGDSLEVVMEREVAEDGQLVRTGAPQLARLRAAGRVLTLVRFRPANGEEEFYTPQGERVRRDMLRTPLDAARVSSGFGPRRHPILGYMKDHKGLDFAAPEGTPVLSAASGVVEEAEVKGTYGNYLRIRHDGGWSTAYAHLSRNARGIKPGVRVHQGQVVAYVGTTGRSTGPHLHYELLKDGTPVDPSSRTQTKPPSLSGPALDALRRRVRDLEQQLTTPGEERKSAERR